MSTDESPIEGRLGPVTDFLRDDFHRFVFLQQHVGGHVHPQPGETMQRRLAHQFVEADGEAGARKNQLQGFSSITTFAPACKRRKPNSTPSIRGLGKQSSGVNLNDGSSDFMPRPMSERLDNEYTRLHADVKKSGESGAR